MACGISGSLLRIMLAKQLGDVPVMCRREGATTTDASRHNDKWDGDGVRLTASGLQIPRVGALGGSRIDDRGRGNRGIAGRVGTWLRMAPRPVHEV